MCGNVMIKSIAMCNYYVLKNIVVIKKIVKEKEFQGEDEGNVCKDGRDANMGMHVGYICMKML